MRLLAEHKRTHSVALATFELQYVDLTAITDEADQADVYVRAFQDPAQEGHTGLHLYAFRELADALAFPGTTGFPYDATHRTYGKVVAYAEDQTLDSTQRTASLTNNSGYAPDWGSLGLTYGGAGDAETAWDAVYAYTASPSALVLGEIEAILEARMGTGQVLDGHSLARIKVGAEDYEIVGGAPHVLAVAMQELDTTAETRDAHSEKYALWAEFAVWVGDRASDPSTNTMKLLRRAGAVRSMLYDENRDLNLGDKAVGEIIIGTLEAPVPVAGDTEPYLAARVSGRVSFPVLHGDRR